MSSEINALTSKHEEPPRQRIIRAACTNCHDRKVRCDAHKRGFPCSNCITHQRPSCRKYEKKKRLTSRRSSQPVLIRRKSVIQVPNSFPDANGRSGIGPSAEIPIPDARVLESLPESGPNPHLVEYVDQKDIRNRSLLRGERITYLGKDVSNVNFLVRQRNAEDSDSVHHVAADEVVGRFVAHNPDRIPREAFILPDRQLSDQLVEAYFTHVNVGCPLVDEEIFMEKYRQDPAASPSFLVLQAILLVGAHVSRELPDRDALKETFFRRAKMLYDSRLEKNRDFIIQAALLLTWHSDGPDDTEANAWFWVGIAARTAMGLGLHRYRSPEKVVHIDTRTWRRIWWILVQFDVAVSLFYGRPQAINLDECDVPPLTDSDFEGCGLNVQIEYIIHRTELCVLISKVLRERFGLRISPDDYNAALGNADEALARWSLTLPPSLQALSSNMTLWTASLHLTYNNFLIILHRPHPKASPRMDDHGANDSEICSSAANAIATIFEDLRTRNQLKFLWISDINALFTTMVQISVELRFSNPILAINALRRFDSSLLSLRNLVEYWTNADWILRIFEESSHVQHGIRLGNSTIRNEQPESSYAGPEFSQQKRGGDEQIARDGTATGDHDCLTQSEDVNQDYQVDQNEWGEMIPQTDSISPDFLMSNDDLNSMLPLDSEWREIYWQEPGISESFGDGLWGWP